MKSDFQFVLAMDVIVVPQEWGTFYGPVCVPTVLETEVLWSGLEFVMMVALSSKLFNEH
jgi:hypothetical protein